MSENTLKATLNGGLDIYIFPCDFFNLKNCYLRSLIGVFLVWFFKLICYGYLIHSDWDWLVHWGSDLHHAYFGLAVVNTTSILWGLGVDRSTIHCNSLPIKVVLGDSCLVFWLEMRKVWLYISFAFICYWKAQRPKTPSELKAA